MRRFLGMALYRLLLPLLFIVALPAWLFKMSRRGGFGSGLRERLSFYREPPDFEPSGAVHLHAVSVGETLIALKLLREWRTVAPGQRFVLATGTSTGHAVARESAPEGVRVTYAPLDFAWMVRRYLDRFEPSQIVLLEGEAWPNLLRLCRRRGIPVGLVNARFSPRSRRRYQKFAEWVRPIFSQLDRVAVQEPEDVETWISLGVPRERIHTTGSIKFDPGSGALPERRDAFATMLAACGTNRPVILAVSTHPGEEVFIAQAAKETGALFAVAPRHAERRVEVKAALEQTGWEVVLRSNFSPPRDPANACLVIDSTGELRDWTAHADVVVIGKSFLGEGGQNPCEAVLAGKPVVFGPHMENFEPLASRLAATGGAHQVSEPYQLAETLRQLLNGGRETARGISAAGEVLARHRGATARTVALLHEGSPAT
jgi:3-deoxy-D-manno-octulosonic-acid transferase